MRNKIANSVSARVARRRTVAAALVLYNVLFATTFFVTGSSLVLYALFAQWAYVVFVFVASVGAMVVKMTLDENYETRYVALEMQYNELPLHRWHLVATFVADFLWPIDMVHTLYLTLRYGFPPSEALFRSAIKRGYIV